MRGGEVVSLFFEPANGVSAVPDPSPPTAAHGADVVSLLSQPTAQQQR